MSSWFLGNSVSGSNYQDVGEQKILSSSLGVKQAIRAALYPKSGQRHRLVNNNLLLEERSRFSQLILEHGERKIQDWAVVAYSSPLSQKRKNTIVTDGNNGRKNNNNSGNSGNSTRRRTSSRARNETLWEQDPKRVAEATAAASQRKRRLRNQRNMQRNVGAGGVTDTDSTSLGGSWEMSTCLPNSVRMSRIEGRLHLCSRSIVFEPDDYSRGIIRCSFKKMQAYGPPREFPPKDAQEDAIATTGRFEAMCVTLESDHHALAKEKNVPGPFEHVSVPTLFRFTFLHSSPQPFVDLCQKLFHLALDSPMNITNGKNRENNKCEDVNITPESRKKMIDRVMEKMLDRPFDVSNLVDARERPVTSTLSCSLLTPLQTRQGCTIVTTERVYFQPALSGSDGTAPRAASWLLRDVVATARRYHGLKDTALEIYFHSGSWDSRRSYSSGGGSSILLAFGRKRDREQCLRYLVVWNKNDHSTIRARCLTDRSFVIEAFREWHKGNLSNFDYLLALNCAAGRTFNDLSRYPVFPWVISDYNSKEIDLSNPTTYRDLSKPVGALNSKRLHYFRARYDSMAFDEEHFHKQANNSNMHNPNAGFLYGTHYSAPGYVLYYLVRSMPEHMLCLQNGKFDAPDRLFHSISHCFRCALTNNADVKELIPEFYHTDDNIKGTSGRRGRSNNDYDFLINAKGLQLGVTQNGDRVDDVQVPKWSKSPRDFVRKNRKALESDIVTASLPKWIDLVFGHKSRGKPALDASNLFHPTSYLGPGDLAAMTNDLERERAELQATEFGIVPDTLFCGPHPLQRSHQSYNGDGRNDDEYNNNTDDLGFVSTEIGLGSTDIDAHGKDAWELLDVPAQLRINDDGADTNHARTDVNKDESLTVDNLSSRLTSTGAKQTVVGRQKKLDGIDAEAAAVQEQHHTHATAKNILYSGNGESFGQQRQQKHQSRQSREAIEGGFSSVLRLENSSSNSNTIVDTAEQHLTGTTSDAPPQSTHQSSSLWDIDIFERKEIHSDAVSGCSLVLDNSSSSNNNERQHLLTTTSLDGGLKAHKIAFHSGVMDDSLSRRGFKGTLSRFSYMAINTGMAVAPSQLSSSSFSSSLQQHSPSKKKLLLKEYRSHASRDPLACLAVVVGDASDEQQEGSGRIAFAGGHDDVVFAYGIHSGCAVASVYSHRDAVTGLDVIARRDVGPMGKQRNVSSVLWPKDSTHILVSGSWDATVKVWSATVVSRGETVSVNREPLAELFDADSSVVCVSAFLLEKENAGGIVVCAGCADGSFCAWNLHDDGVKVAIHNEQAKRGSGPCSVVKWTASSDGSSRLRLFTGFSTGKVASFILAGGTLQKERVVNLGIAVNCFGCSEGILLVGCADGGLRLICVGDDNYNNHGGGRAKRASLFSEQPTLWKSVNNTKTSPGISSISIAFKDDTNQCICCTGAEDGSVALFELKKGR